MTQQRIRGGGAGAATGGARALLWLGVLAGATVFGGCGGCSGSAGGGGDRDGSADGAAGDGSTSDGSARDGERPPPPRQCVVAQPIDMIWVVDDSSSMAEEQTGLAANFPALIEVLTNPPDADDDGLPDFPPLTDLRVGIVSTDLGVGGTAGVIGCDAAGAEGRFVTASRAGGAGCAGAILDTPPWLTFDPASPDAFTADFGCLAQLGTDGCGLEQQLEAMHRALFVHTAPGGPHEGFLRDDSMVAIVFVTDEDDCSAADEAVFDPAPSAVSALGKLGVRCGLHPELLHPVSRYIAALEGLALDRRGDVVVAAITGVPRDVGNDPAAIDYDALLDDARMQVAVDPLDDNALVPACEFGGVGKAPPARRIVELVRAFADTGDGVVQSICTPDLQPSIRAIAQIIASRLCPPPI